MNEILLPRTDAGVALQVAVVVVLLGLAVWRARDRPDLRLLVIGVGVVILAAMALRAAH